MAEFRKTEGGGLEVLSGGVWTTVPPEAAAEIERLSASLKFSSEQIAVLREETDELSDEVSDLRSRFC